MSMEGVLRAVESLCQTEVVGAGIVDSIYVGVSEDERQVLLTNYPYLILDDGGEGTIDTVVNAMQVKSYNVIFELGTRGFDIREATLDLLSRWERLEEIIFHPDNRRLEDGAVMVCESLGGFPPVEPGKLVAGDNPASTWRFRRSTVPYRLGICRGGRHPWGP
jgi:hypothetical protein